MDLNSAPQNETERPVLPAAKTKRRPSALPIARAAVIAAVYCLLTVFTGAVSYGPIQLRVGEAMTLLPLVFPEAVLGLTLGCLLANIWSPFGWYDILFGTLATALAAVMTFGLGRLLKNEKIAIFVAALPPIIINTALLPLVWFLFGVDEAYLANTLSIFLTETCMVYAVGVPLTFAIKRLFRQGGTL